MASPNTWRSRASFAPFGGSDPWADPSSTHAPITDEVDVVVVGRRGSGGVHRGSSPGVLCGVGSVRLVEKAADFGGTWYWNRYPGIAFDVESYVYMPLLEELGYVPKEKYSDGSEIFDHCPADRRALRPLRRRLPSDGGNAKCAGTERRARWLIGTNRGDDLRARFVVLRQRIPPGPSCRACQGSRSSAATSFHTSRWDYAYTGGDSDGGMAGLADKRVGVIGTGATAVQCVPHFGVAPSSSTCSSARPRRWTSGRNKPTDPEWAGHLEAGLAAQADREFPASSTAGGVEDEDLIGDGWTSIVRNSSRCGEQHAAACP